MGRRPMKNPTEKLKTPKKVREAMFAYWMATENKKEVSKKFKVAYTTVRRISKREAWPARRLQVIADAEKKTNAAIIEKELTNLELVKGIRRGVATRLLERMKEGKYHATVRDFVLIMELEGRLAGNIPTDPEKHVINIFNKLPEAEQNQLALDTAKVRDAIKQRNRFRIT